ncbi:hypothetical protein QTP88_010162 [Uroleucon formosanum]
MERYTIEQRVLFIKTHYKHGECVAVTVRKLRTILGYRGAPTATTITRLVSKFEETGSTANIKSPRRKRSQRTNENIAVVNDSVIVSPSKSIRRRSQQLGIGISSLQRILKNDLHLHAYKIQLTQELKPADHTKRREFVNWILTNQRPIDFVKKIIFSDEAHFHLSGYVNKQNCRIWGNENPRASMEKQMHPQRVTVWCGFWAGGVIGPYFFEDERGNAETVNGDRYRNMISNFLWPILDDMDTEEMWFQQDGATCHTSGTTIALIREKFDGRLISILGDQQWPPRRQKSRVYVLLDSSGIEVKVCKNFFQNTLLVSAGRIDRVLKNKGQKSTPPSDRRGKGPSANKTSQEKIAEIKDFIKKFPAYESHYALHKSINRKYMSPDLNIIKLYSLYTEQATNPVSNFVFRKIINEEFNLSFHPPVSDSCRKCDAYAIKIKAAESEAHTNNLKQELELHQRKAMSARTGLQNDTELAKNNPEDVTVITFDLMKTLPTPLLSTVPLAHIFNLCTFYK